MTKSTHKCICSANDFSVRGLIQMRKKSTRSSPIPPHFCDSWIIFSYQHTQFMSNMLPAGSIFSARVVNHAHDNCFSFAKNVLHAADFCPGLFELMLWSSYKKKVWSNFNLFQWHVVKEKLFSIILSGMRSLKRLTQTSSSSDYFASTLILLIKFASFSVPHAWSRNGSSCVNLMAFKLRVDGLVRRRSEHGKDANWLVIAATRRKLSLIWFDGCAEVNFFVTVQFLMDYMCCRNDT